VRSILPDAFVVVGGHHASILPGEYNIDSIDAIVRGEGCAPFGSLVEDVQAGKRVSGIRNVLVPGKDYNPEAASRIPDLPDLATIPRPRRDLYDTNSYKCIWPTEKHPNWQTIFPSVALVRTSYGCVMDCSFCVIPVLSGKQHMTRDPDAVAEEIAELEADHVYFCDDETFMNTAFIKEVATAIKNRGIKKRYFAWARSTTVNRKPELFRLWRSIGLDAVFLGFEATSDEELENLSKHSTVSENERAHVVLRDMGIAVQAGFMVNSEYTNEDFDRLQDYVKKMPPAQVTFTVYTPSPGSSAWKKEKNTFIGNHLELSDCMHPLNPTKMPLRRYYKRLARLIEEAGKKNPLRAPGNRLPPLDIVRIVLASRTYSRCLKKAYRDYPKEMQ
jgi:radical SAM superfamily enzyme YgiQ (UPF0313 family)